MTASNYKKHLTSVNDISIAEVNALLSKAQENIDKHKMCQTKPSTLKGQLLINLFYENSTRTRSSFEIAAKRLGMDVVNISESGSSTKKGETLHDTIATVSAMGADFIVMRHSGSGMAQFITKYTKASVINAGDGSNEHPTQALLDALTIKQVKGSFSGLNVGICGDIMHSRVARSNLFLLKKLGAKVHLIGPATLIPSGFTNFADSIYYNLSAALPVLDVLIQLRIQNERMSGSFLSSPEEYYKYFAVDHKKLEQAKPDILVMHPGPINRGVEISPALADDESIVAINRQVENGVAMRQAIIEMLASIK